jgi:hypothetical protein
VAYVSVSPSPKDKGIFHHNYEMRQKNMTSENVLLLNFIDTIIPVKNKVGEPAEWLEWKTTAQQGRGRSSNPGTTK